MTTPEPEYERAFWSWQLHGHCLGHPTELFFPEEETSKRVRRQLEERAKQICRTCPVLATCREHALSTPERHGVWGAMTTRERLQVSAAAS